MKRDLKNVRLSLLWRTIILLTLFVVICQLSVYKWIEHSVSTHFRHMDSEILTHAAFNLRKQTVDYSSLTANQSPLSMSEGASKLLDHSHIQSNGLSYDIATLTFDTSGRILGQTPRGFASALPADFDILALKREHGEQQFELSSNNRHYRAIIIQDSQTQRLKDQIQPRLYLLALPIDVHQQYLKQFNIQLRFILLGVTLLLVSVAALGVYWGFAPLTTFIQKMKRISSQQLHERIEVSEMPNELRPLAESYNAMMDKLESNFESLSSYSDNIAHELRTPLATLSTQTQVMLSQSREKAEYIEQLHHQHETLEQLSSLVNNMLLLAKTQKGLVSSQLKSVDTQQLLDKLINYYEIVAEEKHMQIKKSGAYGYIEGDENLLQRLFSNLLANAIYYGADASTINIETAVRPPATADKHTSSADNDPSTVVVSITNLMQYPLEISDTSKLFDRFYRHHPQQHVQTGAGLGLSIAKAIVNAHHGRIDVAVIDKRYFRVQVEFRR